MKKNMPNYTKPKTTMPIGATGTAVSLLHAKNAAGTNSFRLLYF